MKFLLILWLAACCACVAAPLPRADVATSFALTDDGVRIAFDARGSGEPTLVFVHCWCGDREFWREQLDVFAREQRVVALDLSGHGESGAHSQASIDALGGDVVAVCDALALNDVVLIGHSLGGPASLNAAARMRGRVAAVIGVETMHDVEMDVPARDIEALLASFERDFRGQMRQAVRALLPASTERDLVDWITRKACAARSNEVLAISRALIGVELPALLASANVPVRCINSAAHAPAIRPTSIEHNRKHADFDAVLIDGTGHYPQLERPEEFNRVLRGLLAGLSASRP